LNDYLRCSWWGGYDLKGQYITQIGELGQKQARQVELKTKETPERKN